jgi:hypothetical protein
MIGRIACYSAHGLQILPSIFKSEINSDTGRCDGDVTEAVLPQGKVDTMSKKNCAHFFDDASTLTRINRSSFASGFPYLGGETGDCFRAYTAAIDLQGWYSVGST